MTIKNYENYEEPFKENNRNGIKDIPTFTFIKGDMPVIVTAPHTVKTMKIEQEKVVPKQSEPYTGAITRALQEKLGCYAMYRNNYPDEYSDPRSFIPDLYNFIIENNIKYLVDIHGLARKHPSEICVGTGRGELVNYDSNLVYLMDKSFDKVDILC